MLVLYLEALAALALFLLAVWWTMFAGRKKGELPPEKQAWTPVEKTPPAAEEEQSGPGASD